MKKIRFLVGVLGLLCALPAPAQSTFEEAKRVAGILGIGRAGACSSCHAMNSEATLKRWSRAYFKVLDQCIENRDLPAKDKVYCMAGQSTDQALQFRAATLGFWAAGLHLKPVTQVLEDGLGAEQAKALETELRSSTAMPLRAPALLTEAEFQAVRAWVGDGMPYLSELIAPYQGPTTCEAFVAPAVQTHLRDMQTFGWKKRNLDRGLFHFACAVDGGNCFRQQRGGQDIFPEVSQIPDFAAWKAVTSTEMRVLASVGQETEYWIRSSADGRFVAFGGSPSGVIDLQSLLTGSSLRTIAVDAYYDPAFFPDDSAFVFQGHDTAICSTSLLKNPQTTSIDFSEDACTAGNDVRIPLYQAVGASLDGADYLAATGEFRSDEGHGATVRDARSKLLLQPIEYDGARWLRREPQTLDSAWELDWGLAPSNRLLLSRLEGRVGEDLQHIGYQLYALKKSGAYSKELIGRLCFDGLKVGFSYDDRFVVSYSYISADQYALLGYASPDDPAFKARLEAGTANVFLYDLWTQKLQLVTQMGPGQFALFPHFRSDGWIYFMVYDQNSETRRIMAVNNARLLGDSLPIP